MIKSGARSVFDGKLDEVGSGIRRRKDVGNRRESSKKAARDRGRAERGGI